MAERRMFAKQIIDSDAFLDMPLSTQALYFHLAMRADDDGFINNVRKIQRMINTNDDDFKVLLTKNFIIPFQSGVCVIKHWLIHNYIQKDRYKPTAYKDEIATLEIKKNQSYTQNNACIHDVYMMDTQVRLGKVRLGEVKKNISRKIALDDGFNEFWLAYPKKVAKAAAQKAWVKHKPNLQNALNALQWQTTSEQWRKGFIPNPATYLNEGRWDDEPLVERMAF